MHCTGLLLSYPPAVLQEFLGSSHCSETMGMKHVSVFKLDQNLKGGCRKCCCCCHAYLLNILLVDKSSAVSDAWCLSFKKFQVSVSSRLGLSAVQQVSWPLPWSDGRPGNVPSVARQPAHLGTLSVVSKRGTKLTEANLLY